MLDSIFINNYRNLRAFKISSLGRVNLFTGKNNTGKSTLLEALAIFATKGELSFIYDLLAERGEKFRRIRENDTSNVAESNVKTFASLFANRIIGFEESNAITIGATQNINVGNVENNNLVTLRFVKFLDEMQKDESGTLIRKRSIVEDSTDNQFGNYKIGFEAGTSTGSRLVPLDEERPYRIMLRRLDINNVQFIRTRNIDREINGRLWDNITLTEKENHVIEALKIIEPSTERIAFIGDSTQDRYPVIKLTDGAGVIPLRSMGDGMNRILTIILALINADNGYLLIDEFENGLHYSVQEKLWKIVFNLANRLNVQVFVTTHSEDCIVGFENVLNGSINNNTGKLIRLDNERGFIKQVEFNAHELKIATDQNIETR